MLYKDYTKKKPNKGQGVGYGEGEANIKQFMPKQIIKGGVIIFNFEN